MSKELLQELDDTQSEKIVGGAGRGGDDFDNPGFLNPWPALIAAGFAPTHHAAADNGDNGAQNIDVGVPR